MSLVNLIHTGNFNSKLLFMALAGLSLMIALPVLAGADAESGMDWGVMTMKLYGGLALFLFGMEQMADSLKAVAGERMKGILAKLTSNRFMGAATGAFVTAIIQSSSVTTVLVVGFISAGLMSMAQSVGIIMGANIGTTITAQIVAFKVTKAALLMIGIGFTMLFASKQERTQQYGTMLMGLGLVFFGMSVMSDGMNPLRSYQPFLDLMIKMENPLIGILVAAAFTGLIQSSSATTGIVIVMASQGFITLPAGIALAMGANIGTCVTALLASIGKPREAVRAAVVGAETPRQIANAHTIFNIANTLIFIGFTTQIARLVEKIIPDTPLEEEGMVVRAKYLSEELLGTPTLALDRVRLEVLHMGEMVQEMLGKIMPAILSGNRETLSEIRAMDEEVDLLYDQIIEYMGKISKQSLSDFQTQDFLQLMSAVSDLENIGDTIETNLVDLGFDRIDAGISISKPTREVLSGLHQVVTRAFESAVQAVSQSNQEAALSVIAMKQEIQDLVNSAAAHQAERLVAEEPNRIPSYTIEIDIIEKQKRIYLFSKSMAKSVLASDSPDSIETVLAEG